MATDARGRCLMATGARVATRLPDRIAGAPLWAERSHRRTAIGALVKARGF
jgi:hypothetical protein